MAPCRILFVATIGVNLLLRSAAMAQANGDFESPLGPEWNPRGNVTTPVFAGGTNEYAQLKEPGTSGIGQIWQAFDLPNPAPSYLAFRYRFSSVRDSTRPRITAAVSRKAHNGVGEVDFDVRAGETEPRSASTGSSTTDLLLVVTFDRSVSLLGRNGGDIIADSGVVGSPIVIQNVIEVPNSGLPHAARVNVAFPGVSAAAFPALGNATDAALCVVLSTGDYNGDGESNTYDLDLHESNYLTPQAVTAATAHADFNLDGWINAQDRDDVRPLLPLPAAGCPFERSSGSSLPPDSFMAFLVRNDGTATRHSGQMLNEFTSAFLYEDSNGNMEYDSSLTFGEEAADGLRRVSLNLSSFGVVGGDSVRLVFGMALAENDAQSTVAIDDVYTQCPTHLCCDPATGLARPVDDGLLCTIDECDLDGTTVHHTIADCCGECEQVPINMVIMIDVTSSVVGLIDQEKEAARQILRRFAAGTTRPYVALGSFNVGSINHARIHASLTDVYGTEGPPATGLYAQINNLPSPTGSTNLAAAIQMARTALPEPELAESYIVLISDGLPNVPSDGCTACACPVAQFSAEIETAGAEEIGIDIIAIHFGFSGGCSGEEFMRERMATQHGSDGFFFDGVGQLECTFQQIASLVACDDQNPCTIDECIFGVCKHTSITYCQP